MAEERGPQAGGEASPPRAGAGGAAFDDAARLAALERHVDFLLGQLYHQIDLIQFHKSRADHLEKEFAAVRDAPRELDEALRRIANFREEIAGRKEIEMDLRRRLEVLELEEKRKTKHIRKIEGMLTRIWSRPHNRFGRFVKRALGLGRAPDFEIDPSPADDAGVARPPEG